MTVYRDRKSGLYRYDFQLAGKRHTERGFEAKQHAKDAEHEKRKALTAGLTDPFPTFSDLVDAFLASSERTKSRDWCYQLRLKLQRGFGHLMTLRPRGITRGHIEPVLVDLAGDGLKATTVNEYRKIVIAALNYGVAMGAVPINVASSIPKSPEDAPSVQPIPKAHLQQIILAAEPARSALYLFLSQTGARFVEAERLKRSEVFLERDRPGCILTTRKRTGGHEHKRPCTLNALAVDALRRAVGSGERVFGGPHGGELLYETELHALTRLCGKLGLPHYSFHQIRHYVGGVASKMGKNKRAVAEYLGQSDTAATDRYMHFDNPELWEIAQRLEQELAELVPAVETEKVGT